MRMFQPEGVADMDDGVGWIAAIIIGGLAGWIASNFMKSDTGIFMNIILGIIGAAIASFLFELLGVSFGGWIGYFVAGFIGACILIGGARAIRGCPLTVGRGGPRSSRDGDFFDVIPSPAAHLPLTAPCG